MSVILGVVSPANMQHWIAINAAGSAKATVTDSWIAYLSANGGTGKTIHDLESSFLDGAAIAGSKSMHDRWWAYLAAQPGVHMSEKARNKYH